MALSSSTVWEVRATGSDANGGGFVAGASGTDYSQQDAAQFSGTNLVVDATTNTKVTSATHNFAAADVGNTIQISAGTSWTTGFYQIVSVASNAATLDRSPAATSTTGGTWVLGGAMASLGGLGAAGIITGNVIWLKYSASAYAFSGTTYNVSGGPLDLGVTNSNGQTWIQGYEVVRGDSTGNKPLLQWSSNPALVAYMTKCGGCGLVIKNVAYDGNSFSNGRGHNQYGNPSGSNHRFCKFTNFATASLVFSPGVSGSFVAEDCEFAFCSATGIITGIFTIASRCIFHDNTGWISDSTLNNVSDCLFYNNPGLWCLRYTQATGYKVQRCTFYGNAHPILVYNNAQVVVENNVFYGGSAYAVAVYAGLGPNNQLNVNNNAFGNNTSGAIAPSIGEVRNSISLTADPFTNAAAGDFSLNNVAGGGKLCRGAGIPGVFPGGLTTGYPDIGAVQSKAVGGLLYLAGMNGGMP